MPSGIKTYDERTERTSGASRGRGRLTLENGRLFEDVPRIHHKRAVVAGRRNDEHPILGGHHAAATRFHNERGSPRPGGSAAEIAAGELTHVPRRRSNSPRCGIKAASSAADRPRVEDRRAAGVARGELPGRRRGQVNAKAPDRLPLSVGRIGAGRLLTIAEDGVLASREVAGDEERPLIEATRRRVRVR
jgi:hypothetical protein